MPQIAHTDPCPFCESGKAALKCCMPGGLAEPIEGDTRPRAPRTGFAHGDCYASALNDCSPSITGEHYLSKSVLDELRLDRKTIMVTGFPWQRAPKPVGVAALTANVLCERHNSALSPLDAQAARLFRHFRAVEAALNAGAGGGRVFGFPGADIERWLLKVLMGTASAGAARGLSGESLAWSPPEMWCRILFGQVSFPRSWGLYAEGRLGASVGLDGRHVSIAPVTTEGGISGCVVGVASFRLMLAMTDVGPRRSGALDEHSVYRPNCLRFTEPVSQTVQSLCFAWTRGVRGGGEVELIWTAPPTP